MSAFSKFIVTLCFVIALSPAANADWSFIRGDTTDDGARDLADVVLALQMLFGGTPAPCLDVIDVDDSGFVNLADVLALLQFLYAGGTPPPPPSDECGLDPSPDAIACLGPVSSCPQVPVFQSTPSAVAYVGLTYQYDAQVDVEETLVTYAVVIGPATAELDPMTGQLSWIPEPADVGEQTFQLTAQLMGGIPYEQTFEVEVQPAPAPLVLDPVPSTTSDATITLSGTAEFSTEVIVTTDLGFIASPVIDDIWSVDITLPLNIETTLQIFGRNDPGQTTDTVDLSIIHDDIPPTVTITCPTDGATARIDQLSVRGTVTDAAEPSSLVVDVNGISATVDEDGDFSASGIALSSGSNTLVITATDLAENVGSATTNVMRETGDSQPFGASQWVGFTPDSLLDVDLDGNLDAITDNAFRLGEGDGSFGPEVPRPSGRLEDVTGDGLPDITNVDGLGIRIQPGIGGGLFGVEDNYPWFETVDHWTLGDFNDDGLGDVAFSAFDNTTVPPAWGVWVALRSLGGGFITPLLAYSDSVFGLSPRLDTLDFNNDGTDDLIAKLSILGQSMSIVNNGSGLAFTPGNVAYVTFAVYGDCTGDGVPDAGGQDNSTIHSIYSGQDDGTFTYLFSDGPIGPLVDGNGFADIDGDGVQDATWQRGDRFSAYFGAGPRAGTLGVFNGPRSGPGSYPARTVVAGDLNGDASEDFITGGWAMFGGAIASMLEPYVLEPGGVVLPWFDEIVPTITDADAGDLNGDGVADMVTIGPGPDEVRIYFATPSSTVYESAQLVTLGTGLERVDLVDFDSDGDLDIALLDSSDLLLLRNVAGDFSSLPPLQRFITMELSEFDSGDFNQDGYPDFLLGNSVNDNVAVLLSPSGGATDLVSYLQTNLPHPFTTFPTNSLEVLGDVNNDGFEDFRRNSGRVWAGNNLGGFDLILDSPISMYSPTALADIDHDGYSELMFGNWSTSIGASSPFTPGSGIQITESALSDEAMEPDDMLAADFDGDGNPDLVLLTGERLTFMRGNGDFTFTEATAHFAAPNAVDLKLVDYESDGDTDVLIQGGANGGIRILRNRTVESGICP